MPNVTTNSLLPTPLWYNSVDYSLTVLGKTTGCIQASVPCCPDCYCHSNSKTVFQIQSLKFSSTRFGWCLQCVPLASYTEYPPRAHKDLLSYALLYPLISDNPYFILEVIFSFFEFCRGLGWGRSQIASSFHSRLVDSGRSQHGSSKPCSKRGWAPAYCLPSNRGSAVEDGLPEEANAIGDPRKTTETDTRSPLPKVYACLFPGQSSRQKIWATNQSN